MPQPGQAAAAWVTVAVVEEPLLVARKPVVGAAFALAIGVVRHVTTRSSRLVTPAVAALASLRTL